MSDCIKIAVDFVSPENITRCRKLTAEFRAMNEARDAWKEDVLQLHTMMWFAWLSCKNQEAVKRAKKGKGKTNEEDMEEDEPEAYGDDDEDDEAMTE